jgi:hypothetical protein
VFDLADGLQGLLCGSARVGVPLFDEQGVADLRHRYTETQADGAAVLVPVAGGSGGDYSSRFRESLAGWQVGQPLVSQAFGEWLGGSQRSCECGWAFECEQVGWVGAVGK